ncbi:MAG: YibE/F family protein [Acidimicrobiia bacterium]
MTDEPPEPTSHIDHVHVHGHGGLDVDPERARAIWIAAVVCGAITLLLAILLWPSGDGVGDDPLLLDADPVDAEVIGVDLAACSFDPIERCARVRFELDDGRFDGDGGAIEETSTGRFDVGDRIRVVWFDDISGERIYSVYDFQRDRPMLLLVALFAAAVIGLGRWRGVGALAGLAASLLVIVWFTLPAILDGTDPVLVAVVSASIIAFLALFLAHGIEPSTAVALVATLASLVLTALLAQVFVSAARFTGMSDDPSLLLSGLGSGVDPRGILLAGIVIGSLGVLDDVTVTQVSAVWQLKSLRPELSSRELVTPALRIGRDHISSTVNTLFLAYAGTSLPLLLLFVEADQGFGNIVTRELVATEVVRALVGSIGLVASVPIATWLAALVVSSD